MKNNFWRLNIYKQNFRQVYRDQTPLHIVCDNYINYMIPMLKNHGVTDVIKFHKEIRRFVQQSCMDQRTTLNQDVLPFWLSTRKGWPTYLIKNVKTPWKDLMKDFKFRQGLMTICNSYMLLKAPVSYDISTITQVNLNSHTSEFATLCKNISNHFKRTFFMSKSKGKFIDVPFIKSGDPVFPTPKAGANGPNALGDTSILDCMASYESGIYKTQFEIARRVFTLAAFKIWARLFRESFSTGRSLDIRKKLVTGRLHFLKEGGGKTRVIAIPDIWSQSVLKPIHDYLYKIIRRLPCDGTFSHSKISKKMRTFTKHSKLTCYDLKAATDRMPIDQLQTGVLSTFMDSQLVSLWRDLMVDRCFFVKPLETSVRYKVGQPMGLLTSWASLNITHHAIINFAKKDKSFYSVIGDDMGMHSKHGAKVYKKCLDILGMEISIEKSVTSTDRHNLGEIAKRLFVDGGEISPIPPDILLKSTGTIIGYLEFIRVFSERFHHTDQGGFSDSEFSQILEGLYHTSSFKENEEAQILLSCPILDNFPILPTLPHLRVTSLWSDNIPKIQYLRDFERFLSESTNNRVNEKVTESLLHPLESANRGESPLYKEYLKSTLKKVDILHKRINTTYIDEEADSFANDSITNLRDILSFPSLIKGKEGNIKDLYLSKRKLKIRNTSGLIQQFYNSKPHYKA